ncbi:long-chain-fatty-acid--CoA ligase 5 [Trichonephila clavipes]|nr:long-chain-fatty-acid--CoA ligase 5 [Trichonephila clavipes]
MKFLGINSDIIQLEEGVRNAFRWNWIERRDGNGDNISTWCKEINVAGQAYCVFCNSLLKYAREGFKAFTNHSKTVTHIKYSKCIRHSMTLSNYANSKNTDDLLETDARPLDIVTRKARQEVLITSFIAENSLSFNVAPNLIELCKQLSRDQTALNSLEMSRTTACYKMKYGLAKTIKENITKTLKETPFSLNLDESASNAQESILAILVQFYDNNQNEVVVHHFASLKMESCNSEAVFKAVVNTIEDNIPWANLISVLMDSCNTMRGKKKGVETRLRSNKAPHLLFIDGDTCHTANNCAKKKKCFMF